MKYEDKLRDPRWQRKRLAIMSAAGWKCQDCGDHEEELHVHHLLYSADRDPWDYADVSLLCICNTCHTIRHLNQAKVKAHAERLSAVTKNIYVFNRWWRFTKELQSLHPETRVLLGQIMLEYKTFEKSVKDRVGALKMKLFKANLTEREKQFAATCGAILPEN